ncbi:hypothetical protein CPB85DRAFT_1429947 [Mucidula mucida]|nr:hypothetical protein CPB85DRAFT_1429947 [Mucidula mucida]
MESDLDLDLDTSSLAESSATTTGSSYYITNSPPSYDPSSSSDWDDMIPAPPRVRVSETEEVFFYSPAPGVVREETRRHRRRHITVQRTRKGHIHVYEPRLSRDFFLIITLCFASACFLVCLIRPYAIFWIADAIS